MNVIIILIIIDINRFHQSLQSTFSEIESLFSADKDFNYWKIISHYPHCEFVKKLGIVITLFLDFAACIIILIFLEGRGLNDHFSFFCLIVWIIFNIIEVIILIYKWMLEDKNTGGIPRTQLIMTIIFGILSFIVGKLSR